MQPPINLHEHLADYDIHFGFSLTVEDIDPPIPWGTSALLLAFRAATIEERRPLPAVRGGGGTRHRPGRPGRVPGPGRPRRPGNRPCAGGSRDPGLRRASSNDIRSDAMAPGSDLYRVKMYRDVLPGKRGNGSDPARMKSVRRFYLVKVKAEFYPVKGR